MHKKCSWQDIIDSNAESIQLIWFGSILNKNTHKWDMKSLYPVVIHEFKRIYNMEFLPESIPEQDFDMVLEYCRKYGIENHDDIRGIQKKNYTVLSTVFTWNKSDYLNAVLVEIPRSDFQHYAKREWEYDLYKTSYKLYDPNLWTQREIPDEKFAYVLVAPDDKIVNTWEPFMPYHENTRAGAYDYGTRFGQMFDETTYNVEWNLVYKE